MTRRMYVRRLRDALRRRNRAKNKGDDARRTRISVPYWTRTHRVVQPERDPSEWVRQKMTSDWDSVKQGRNRGR